MLIIALNVGLHSNDILHLKLLSGAATTTLVQSNLKQLALHSAIV